VSTGASSVDLRPGAPRGFVTVGLLLE